MNTPSNRNWLEERRARKRAGERRRQWEQLQGGAPPVMTRPMAGAGLDDGHRTGSGHTPRMTTPGTDRRRGRMTLMIGLAGFLAAAVTAGATPLASEGWNILVLMPGLVLSGIAFLGGLRGWPHAGSGLRTGSVLMAAGFILAGIVGAVSQNSVNGKVQLRNSELDQAIELRDDMQQAIAVLADNHRLFALTGEQSLGLGETYRAAFEQAVRIGEAWNPATLELPPVAELLEAAELLNFAAARQATAFDRFIRNMEAPEPAVLAEAQELAAEVDALLQRDLPAAVAAVDDAIARRVS